MAVTKTGVVSLWLRYGDEDWGASIFADIHIDAQPRLNIVRGGENVW
jgi:hypothetical protein